MTEHSIRGARGQSAADAEASGAAPQPEPEPSKYDLAHLCDPTGEPARAVGSTPGELRAALHGLPGPWSQEDIRGALESWRRREIPAG